MTSPFTVRIPASTSNLGSGFDTISAALTLYLTLRVEARAGSGLEWLLETGEPLPFAEEDNLVARAFRDTLALLGRPSPGLRITMHNPIPLRRGLGSSGAAIIAGIKMAGQITGTELDTDQIFQLAFPLEGHPDNLAASLLGGWVVSWVSGRQMGAERLQAKLPCRFVFTIPDTPVATREARDILPDSYPLNDVTYNLQRCALLVHALSSGRRDLLREATSDRLHQPFRRALVPGLQQLLAREELDAELAESLLGMTISGSGSASVGLADGQYQALADWMKSTLARYGTRAETRLLDLDSEGALVLPGD